MRGSLAPLLVLAVAWSSAVPLLYVVAFFISIGTGLCYPSLTSMVTKATPPAEHGSMLGIATAVGSLARFVGPIAMGFLYDLAQALDALCNLLSKGALAGGRGVKGEPVDRVVVGRTKPLRQRDIDRGHAAH